MTKPSLLTPSETADCSLVCDEEPKPLLRGWSHLVAAVAAVGVTIGLLAQTYGDIPRFVSLLVFGISMIALYAVSATLHLGRWRGRLFKVLCSLDHANIFLIIAATYTPFCVVVLSGGMRIMMLALIWGLALVGIVCLALSLRLPRWVMVAQYVAMGWLAVLMMPSFIRELSIWPVLVLLIGGVLYTVGGVIYARRRPNPLPRIFGFHEIFHLCVIGGNVATGVTIWFWVAPIPVG